MRAFAPMILLVTLLAGCAAQQRGVNDPPPVRRDGGETRTAATESNETLEQMLERDDFDLPRALLLFSEKYYPEFASVPRHEVDIPAKLGRFEAYAEQLSDALRQDNSPRQRVRTLVDFIHIKLGLRFDQNDSRGENYENLFFDSVLQRRFGYCVSLSMAYLVFGQAAGLDVKGIRLPGHFVVEFKDTEPNGQPYKTLLETTAFGETREETYYWARDRFSATAVENGVYLTPLNDREIFGTLYNNLAGVTYVRGNPSLAVERYTRALELAPNNCESLYNRAIVQHGLKLNREALRDLNEALRLDPTFVLAMLARAALLWDAGEHDPAREDLNHAKRLRPEWPQTWMIEGTFLFESGDIDAARDAFETALEKDPKYNSAHIALAELEHKAGNEAAAHKHEEAAGMR
ncbi:MAG: tetratricopeptide repeat protein [Planctomycetes bacterium]|nr:tetratricopeptide repeat protein [Planctomycetota bacterium]